MDELIKDKNNVTPQVDGLLLQLDECTKERDEARSQVSVVFLDFCPFPRGSVHIDKIA